MARINELDAARGLPPAALYQLYRRVQDLLKELAHAQAALLNILAGGLSADECRKVAKRGLESGYGLIGKIDGE